MTDIAILFKTRQSQPKLWGIEGGNAKMPPRGFQGLTLGKMQVSPVFSLIFTV